MRDTQFDPAAFKAQQREQWSNAAEGWRNHWASIEQGAQPLSDRMMELAHIAPGQRVLDVATGIGEPALTAARIVGPNGSVTAIDQAPQMLAVARERMQTAGIQNVEFIEGDAEAVTLPPDSFDAVVSRLGIMLFNDPASTLARFKMSLKPGGWLVVAVWGPPERVPSISLSYSVLSRMQGQPPSPPGGPNPFALSEPGRLEQILRDAGFVQVQSEPFTVTFTFPSADDLVDYLVAVSAPVRRVTATMSAEQQAAFRRQLADAAAPFADASGVIRLPNESLIVAGQR